MYLCVSVHYRVPKVYLWEETLFFPFFLLSSLNELNGDE